MEEISPQYLNSITSSNLNSLPHDEIKIMIEIRMKEEFETLTEKLRILDEKVDRIIVNNEWCATNGMELVQIKSNFVGDEMNVTQNKNSDRSTDIGLVQMESDTANDDMVPTQNRRCCNGLFSFLKKSKP